jgi:hypothetical protein
VAGKELVKLFLHQDYDDVGSVWAIVVGKARGGTLVRLDNVPFAHAKPTYGDVVLAKRDLELEVPYAWNAAGMHLHDDGGRYAAIVDYHAARSESFKRLCVWLRKTHGVMTEGCYGPREDKPGRLYLAVPKKLKMPALMREADARFASMKLTQIHPPVRQPSRRARDARTGDRAPRAMRPKRAARRIETRGSAAQSPTEGAEATRPAQRRSPRR